MSSLTGCVVLIKVTVMCLIHNAEFISQPALMSILQPGVDTGNHKTPRTLQHHMEEMNFEFCFTKYITLDFCISNHDTFRAIKLLFAAEFI